MNLKDTVFKKKIKIWFLQSALIVIFLWIMFMPNMINYEKNADNYFTVKLNDKEVGHVGSREDAYQAYRDARRAIAKGKSADELTLAKTNLSIEGQNIMWGVVDSPDRLSGKMVSILKQNMQETTFNRAYTIKINDYSISLKNIDQVNELLETAVSKRDARDEFAVELTVDPSREVNVLTAQIRSKEEVKKKDEELDLAFPELGLNELITDSVSKAAPDSKYMKFDDYLEQVGIVKDDAANQEKLIEMKFNDKVEIVESYLPENQLVSLATAIEEVTKDKENKEIYEVQTGDTLGSIATYHNLSIDELIAMNPGKLEDEFSVIRPQDEITVNVPKPELSIQYTTRKYIKESYEAKVQEVQNNSWFKNQTKVLQEPSAGEHEVVDRVTYVNDSVVSRENENELINTLAVPKVIMRGKLDPPTYIKPISGGRFSSGFGRRNRPTKGASSFHKGVDWATPVGTAVSASAAGTVTRAGWGSGYGYCVYIKHNDGRETRYGHLSKILVKVGQTVEQGEKIALSGNTGVSTGPHLHFEILVGGSQVNPLDYLN